MKNPEECRNMCAGPGHCVLEEFLTSSKLPDEPAAAFETLAPGCPRAQALASQYSDLLEKSRQARRGE